MIHTTKKSNAKNEQKTAPVSQEKPSDADFLAFMVFHHMNYMITTAKQAGGTNKLFHTRELPTEGTDPVVTPALDHINTKAVIDLTEGPVTVSIPKAEGSRYYLMKNITQYMMRFSLKENMFLFVKEKT